MLSAVLRIAPLRIPDHYAYRGKVIFGVQMIAAEDIETMRG